MVAAPEEDPRGSAFGSSELPLALAGVIAGAGVTLLGLRGSRAVVALAGAASGIGLVGAAITDSWLGVLGGTWWAEAGAYALTALAGSAVVAGCAAVLGTAGIGLGAVINVFLGNPFSGVTTAPEMSEDSEGREVPFSRLPRSRRCVRRRAARAPAPGYSVPSAGRRSGSPSRGNRSAWKVVISVIAPPVTRRTSIVSGRYAPSDRCQR